MAARAFSTTAPGAPQSNVISFATRKPIEAPGIYAKPAENELVRLAQRALACSSEKRRTKYLLQMALIEADSMEGAIAKARVAGITYTGGRWNIDLTEDTPEDALIYSAMNDLIMLGARS
jgi:hypothetical protein